MAPLRVLPPPDPKQWQARGEWFWRAHDINAGPRALEIAAHAELLLGELEAAFCAGAWAATIILAWAIVEAELRDAARSGGPPPEAPDVDWLRARRNAVVHDDGRQTADVADGGDLEAAAKGAVRVVFKTLFERHWR
ncbi:MAG: hypothetical protein HY246_20815 [Proteobacteria bacterium]|nr:hypothetical protein [Pseudomonadota bacterium]